MRWEEEERTQKFLEALVLGLNLHSFPHVSEEKYST